MIDTSLLDTLSEEEKQIALEILQEYQVSGKSKIFNNILFQDYNEVPVDIITFIKDERYLGKAWHDTEGNCKLFPYWEKRLKELFPDNITTNKNNAIFSGARGLGKSEIAVTVGLYLMYRVMCLKNPHAYFGLKPTEKISFAFMNITKQAAEDIGISKFQSTVKLSPWFMEHGKMTGRDFLVWNPPEYIDVIIGSQSSDVIGRPIFFCLDGDTVIVTSDGDYKISDLVDTQIRVKSLSDDNKVVTSDICTVIPTVSSSEEYQIELEDGTVIKCTPNHRFLLKDGTYKEAMYLTESDELAD